jgi:hypothetical protein
MAATDPNQSTLAYFDTAATNHYTTPRGAAKLPARP